MMRFPKMRSMTSRSDFSVMFLGRRPCPFFLEFGMSDLGFICCVCNAVAHFRADHDGNIHTIVCTKCGLTEDDILVPPMTAEWPYGEIKPRFSRGVVTYNPIKDQRRPEHFRIGIVKDKPV